MQKQQPSIFLLRRYQTNPLDMQGALLKIAQHADPNLNPTILDIGQRNGSTDYIDFIKPEEMKSSIRYGTDWARRPFVSYLLHFEPLEQETEVKAFDNVMTLFQRYTDLPRWTHATSHGLEIFETATDKIEFLSKVSILCSGRPITVTYQPSWNVTLKK